MASTATITANVTVELVAPPATCELEGCSAPATLTLVLTFPKLHVVRIPLCEPHGQRVLAGLRDGAGELEETP